MMNRYRKTRLNRAGQWAKFRRTLGAQCVIVVVVRKIKVVSILKRQCYIQYFQRLDLIFRQHLKVDQLRSNIISGLLIRRMRHSRYRLIDRCVS